MKKILFILLLLPTFLFAQNTVNVNVGNYNKSSYTTTIVTEQQSFYHGEFYWNHGLNTSNGAFTSDVSMDISDYMPILPSTSITMSRSDSNTCYIYGWTYDANYSPIAEIRSNILISSKLQNYTFTTPSNAAYLVVLTKYAGDSSNLVLKIKSTNTVTYSSPIVPEQYTGTQTQQIQQAEDFARFTSSPVYLGGIYGLDSAIILSSGSTTLIGGKVFMNVGDHDNVFRNEAVANPSVVIMKRGNRDIKIIGIGSAIIEGSKEKWGSSSPTGVGAQLWRSKGILFVLVNGFTIRDLTFKDQNGDVFFSEQDRNGLITGLTFIENYAHLNQGTIEINQGCSNITVSNLNGVTEDDMVAVQNGPAYNPTQYVLGGTNYLPYGINLDTYGITIRNINRARTSRLGTGPSGQPLYASRIRILATGTGVIHDVSIDGVSGFQEILFQTGVNTYGNETDSSIYNITVSNTGQAPIYILDTIKNSSFINVAKTDITGAYPSCTLPNGSTNIYRKYYAEAPYQIDSVSAGIEYKRTLN